MFRENGKHEGAVLLLVKERCAICNPAACQCADQPSFGAFITEPLHAHPRHYGTGECFLLAASLLMVTKFGATGKNDYYCLGRADEFVAAGCGDGRFGLWLDDELTRGSSAPVATFDNRQLSASEEFFVECVEVWGVSSDRF